jgi:hypothetical protein
VVEDRRGHAWCVRTAGTGPRFGGPIRHHGVFRKSAASGNRRANGFGGRPRKRLALGASSRNGGGPQWHCLGCGPGVVAEARPIAFSLWGERERSSQHRKRIAGSSGCSPSSVYEAGFCKARPCTSKRSRRYRSCSLDVARAKKPSCFAKAHVPRRLPPLPRTLSERDLSQRSSLRKRVNPWNRSDRSAVWPCCRPWPQGVATKVRPRPSPECIQWKHRGDLRDAAIYPASCNECFSQGKGQAKPRAGEKVEQAGGEQECTRRIVSGQWSRGFPRRGHTPTLTCMPSASNMPRNSGFAS